ncbi:hypothetical protein [Rhizobium sp. BK602]|uniref:hypothetical protein n=1 Tax=Rhizobium sp. BK602 TaxID=2586986 RepID=UPI00161C0E49|nr:hypothetical protein [Rhizobium sp. BK602]MBB3609586.1 hypothetical protein [Rhizobium sp. BK602]
MDRRRRDIIAAAPIPNIYSKPADRHPLLPDVDAAFGQRYLDFPMARFRFFKGRREVRSADRSSAAKNTRKNGADIVFDISTVPVPLRCLVRHQISYHYNMPIALRKERKRDDPEISQQA